MIRLGVNIDHVATLRQARGERYPDPVQAAVLCELAGADNITMHLREDRRHIQDADIWRMKEVVQIPINFEIAVTEEMVEIAKKLRPRSVTLVPEKRTEQTTEGGLDLKKGFTKLKSCISELTNAGILVSLFIEPSFENSIIASELKAYAVEFHTGKFCKDILLEPLETKKIFLFQNLSEVSEKTFNLGLRCHFGHGFNYQNAIWLRKVAKAEEANIGHAIISRAIFTGLTDAVKEMKKLINF